MKTLTNEQIKDVSGAADWGQVGAGLGAIGVGIAVAATPVGWVGAAGAAAFAGAGGWNVGSGLMKP